MSRPLEAMAARTHIRISHQTRHLLEDLKKKHGFATTDKVLQYYLPSIEKDVDNNRPVFLTARQAHDLTHNQHNWTDKRRSYRYNERLPD